MKRRVAVVMAGGSGERFWPMSRPDRPKQLLRLTDPRQTMLEEAVNRIRPVVGDDVFISTSSTLRNVIQDARIVATENVLAEPARRNTLGALIWVGASLMARGLDSATVAVLTADHKIGDPDQFCATVRSALDVAERSRGLVTLGITPDRPETGYGYMEVNREDSFAAEDGRPAFRALRFLEKPSLDTALKFVASGRYLWNSGMFFYTVEAFASELANADPAAHLILVEIVRALKAGSTAEAIQAFESLPNISIDFALMEKSKSVYVIPSDFPWDDVGAWDALERSLVPDSDGNVAQGRVLSLDSTGCVLINDDENRTLGVIGLQDVVVVTTQDAVLVVPKSQAQKVRQIAARIAEMSG